MLKNAFSKKQIMRKNAFYIKHNNKNMDALFDRQDAMTKEVAIDGKGIE